MLTGLPESYVVRQAAYMLPYFETRGSIAVVLLDLDRFKDVKRHAGSRRSAIRFLREGCRRRLQVPSPRDATVARLGVYEFALVIPNVTRSRRHATK